MIDINYLRQNSEVVKENLKRRNNPEYSKLVEDTLETDKLWKAEKQTNDVLRKRRNEISAEINSAKKAGKDISKLVQEVKELPKKIEESDTKVEELQKRIRNNLLHIPNLLQSDVPKGKDSSENKTIKEFGKKIVFKFTPVSHIDLLQKWNLADLDRAAKISGARWYFLKGDLAKLEFALSHYAIDFMTKRGYLLTFPPNMMNKRAYEGVTSLATFEDTLYKIEGEDLYCIATSEHPLTAQFIDEVIDDKQLPIKLAGYSPCYRKEAGAHGKDTKGIFRVHQFNKIEQIVICKPEDSAHLHEEITKNIEDFFESLELHCRTIVLCSGDTGFVSAKTNDVEVWMPVQNEYREVGSSSNCTSYQAVRLNIRHQKGDEKESVHTLNSTCVATTRALVAILENFQDEKGIIHIPKVLQKYCGFKTIPSKLPKASKK